MSKVSKYISSSDAEMEMQEVRKANGVIGSTEKILVKGFVENAKGSSMIGDKLQLVINPMYIHIPEWQRQIDKSRALSIGTSYNKYKWDVPKVLYHNGKLWVIDGQHRIYGAFKGKRDKVVVEVLECPVEEAVDIFLNQTNDRKRMLPIDIYNAALVAKKENYVKLRDICHKHSVAVKGEYLANSVGTFTSITDGTRINPNTLDSMLGLLGKLQWNAYADKYNGKAYTAKVVRSLQKMYGYYDGRTEEMEDILVKKCFGTEWFTENIMNLSQGQIFDLLSGIVKHEMDNPLRIVKRA